MSAYDLVVRGGEIGTATDRTHADIAIEGGRIVAIGEGLPRGDDEIDAKGRLVLPGGIDSHCHVEQSSASRIMTADDFYSATVSAAFGGRSSPSRRSTETSPCARWSRTTMPAPAPRR